MAGKIFFTVPKGTPPAVCKAAVCRKPIFWIETPAKKRMPIDCDAEGGRRPTKILPGHGQPHWGTCAGREQFKKPGAEAVQ
jgi:hypothetical protein